MESLENIIESILFLAGNPVSVKELKEKLQVSDDEFKDALEKLKLKFSKDSGIIINVFGEKIQFSTNPKYEESVSSVLNPIRERELSQSMLEVSAIVAYKQPLTRLEVESVRGVNCDYAINMLLKNNLIQVVGKKDAIGKPLLYGTTDEFLKRFQISSLNDLPDFDEILEQIKVINTPKTTDLYDRELSEDFMLPDEEPLPEFLQDEEVENVG